MVIGGYQAACLHLGIIIALEIFNFTDTVAEFGELNWCIGFVYDRDVIRRSSKIDGEGRTVQMLALNHHVNKVHNSPSCQLKRKSQDCVDRNVWACGDHK
jgi:hypothetical protein